MNRILKSMVSLVASVLLLSSCFEDKGIYSYKEINDIGIDIASVVSIKIPKSDSVLLELTPKITQVLEESNDNLSYLWTRLEGGGRVVAGEEQVCRLWIRAADRKDFTVRLQVTDNKLGISSYKEVEVRLLQPFNRCWFILQDMNGQAVLGAVDGEGEVRVVSQDILKEETGGQLEGKPLFLTVNPQHYVFVENPPPRAREVVIEVFTDANGWMLDGVNLQLRYEYNMLLLQKYITGDRNYKPMYATNGTGEIIIDNGVFWYAGNDGKSIFYPGKLETGAGSSYYATMASSVNGFTNLVFDDQNKRFLTYSNESWSIFWWVHNAIRGGNYSQYNIDGNANRYYLSLVGENAKYPNAFDPNNIGADKQMLYMGATTDSYSSRSIAVAGGRSAGMLYIYEFDTEALMGSGSVAPCSGYFELTVEENISDTYSIASSSGYDRIFFFAAGNKIYRADLNRRVPRAFEIYSYPDPNAKITKIAFRSPQREVGENNSEDEFSSYQFNTYLGAAIDHGDGNGSLVEMKLTGAGEIANSADGEPMVYEFNGLKRIVDIGYAYK